MDHFLIEEFSEPLLIIQTCLKDKDQDISKSINFKVYKTILAGNIYIDYDEEKKDTLLNIELTDNNFGNPIWKITIFGKLTEMITSKGNVSIINILFGGGGKN